MQAFSHYFQSDRFADAEICIRHSTDEHRQKRSKRDNEQQDKGCSLFPAHLMILCTSEYFAAQALSQLSPAQLVQTVVYADRLAVTAAEQAAIQLLMQAAEAEAGLTSELSSVLLALPLAALQLLLSSDQLKTDSEDTVLYTAQKYLHVQPQEQWEAVMQGLAPLIRCPLLCDLQLAAHDSSSCWVWWDRPEYRPEYSSKYSSNTDSVLTLYLPQLCMWVQMSRVESEHLAVLKHMQCNGMDVPDSWQLGPRPVSPDHSSSSSRSVSVTWRLPVERLKAACKECSEKKQTTCLSSPVVTAPVAGMPWRLKLFCFWVPDSAAGDAGVAAELYLGPSCFPERASGPLYCKLHSAVGWCGHEARHSVGSLVMVGRADGPGNFFGVGVMTGAGGWDEEAWAAQGLPSEGELELEGTVLSVL
eukprot:gene7835-8032_t